MNRVYNVCKLEIKIIVILVIEFLYILFLFSFYWYGYVMIYLDFGIGDKDCIGNMICVFNGVLYLLCEYFNNLIIGYYDLEFLGV